MCSTDFVKNKKNKINEHHITFSIIKKLKFGQAVYVCGSTLEIGEWNSQEAFRLNWNQNDVWTGELILAVESSQCLEFKYVINDWENPSSQKAEWQVGDHNRKIDLNTSSGYLLCDDKWNIDRISLCLLTQENDCDSDVEYFVTGNLSQLGGWQDIKLMSKSFLNLNNSSTMPLQKNFQIDSSKEINVRIFSFEVFRLQQEFYYYYLRKRDKLQAERKPGRIFKFNNQKACFPCRKSVLYPRGQIAIVDESCLNSLKFSKITQNIFVGSYPKTSDDLAKLKENKIDAILSIQSSKDFDKHGISPFYMRTLCKQKGIKYKRCSIEDMNNPDFVENADEGIEIMEQILSSGENIYVHCSAGIYRSPQMIALYLIAIKNYQLEEAVTLLEERHPYARPSPKVIKQALNIYESSPVKKRISV